MSINTKDLADFYAKGHSMREASAKFGVSMQRIQQLLRRDYPHLIRRKSLGMCATPSERLRLNLTKSQNHA